MEQGMIDEAESLISRAEKALDSVLQSPMVDREDVVPLMNELAALVGKMYLMANNIDDKSYARKLKDLIKGLEVLIGTLKYQYRAFTEVYNNIDN